jgi:hypothetical protein
MPDAPTYHSAGIDSDDDGYVVDSDDAEAFQRPPAGEEGMHHSHAGKEAVFDQIWQKCRPGYVLIFLGSSFWHHYPDLYA